MALAGGLAVPGVDASVAFARPAVLAALPVGAAALWVLLFSRRGGEASDAGGESEPDAAGPVASRRARWALYASRLAVVACLVVAAAGPATVATETTAGDPQVTMVGDESASMGVYDPVADDLETALEDEGVAVERVTAGSGNRSRLGEGLVANLRSNGSLLVVSDGQVTGGPSLARAADLADSLNATVNRVDLSANRSDARVTVSGPAKASVGVETEFGVRVAGVEDAPDDAEVTVSVDGERVEARTVPDGGAFTVSHNFSSVGPHRVTARLAGGDAFAVNDVYYKSVQVVERPEVLYVARGDYPLEDYLSELYDVTRAESVPEELDDYYAVVVQDVAAPDVGSVGALQEFVVGGGGLVVAGGENAYENGGYENARLSSLLPVSVGGSSGREASIALAVDVSGSARSGMRVQKALALDVLSQLGDRNRVGLVGFNQDAYRVADLAPLSDSRSDLQEQIRSLQSGGGTDLSAGLLGAAEALGGEGGTVVLLSDGRDDAERAFAAAERLAERDVRVVTVGVGDVDAEVLRGVAERTGGSYLPADETNRLRVQFGGPNRQYRGDHAVVVDDGHFVTGGVEPAASLPGANEVSVKEGARLLVATGYGAPALSTWRFGLGRVAAITAYGADGSLGDLRTRPDSLLLSRSVNWAIGDPQRKAAGVVSAPDTRVGEPTTVVYAGESPPAVENGSESLSFSPVGESRYEARVTPTESGYRAVLGSSYAVNYSAEYAALGVSADLDRAVERTGGRTFASDESAAIAAAVTRQTTHARTIERSWDWAFLVGALVVYVLEVCARRLRRHRNQEVIP
ncbi:vWA domain-containing protein [Halorussus halobius]|uniref:vWA domain-containing protein n=1 Tax=Halorussus halobius TaxID=1710537 RepID=UPI001092B37D|nr:vWA domain-containing protein [Halorussus halobius]